MKGPENNSRGVSGADWHAVRVTMLNNVAMRFVILSSLEEPNAARMSGGSGVELARRSCSPLDPLVGRSEAEASQRILDPRGVAAPPQRSGNV